MTAQLTGGDIELIVTHQTAVSGIRSVRIHRGYLVACCEFQYFVAVAWVKENSEIADDECVGSLLDSGGEGGFKVETANL